MNNKQWEQLPKNYVEERPWGKFEVLLDSTVNKIKIITVEPNCRLSLQSHRQRSEHWYVLEGTLTVEKGLVLDTIFSQDYKENEYVDIPQGFIHRASNNTESPVRFLEVQNGSYFGEDDIIRYEDDYGRE